MARTVGQLDMNVKNYLESQMGFRTLSCNTSGHSVSYRMYHKENDCYMTYEMCGDGKLKFTIGQECRTLPKCEDLSKQLPETVTQETILRLVFQIVTRLLDNALDSTKVDIRRQFERHSKKLN